MKIINPSIEIMHHGMEIEHIHPEQHIEKVGRTCYKSEDKITDISAAKFVSGLIKRGHEAMIEHYSLIFKTTVDWYNEIECDWNLLMHSGDMGSEAKLRAFLRFTDCADANGEMRYIISGNMRAWRDFANACVKGFGFIPQYLQGMIKNYPLFFPEFMDLVPNVINNTILIPIKVRDLLTDAEKGVHWDITVKFTCDRGVSHEIVRHRTASFAQESTRYCNYGLGKFGGEITVVRPAKWIDIPEGELMNTDAYMYWYTGCNDSEAHYFDMLNAGCTPQEARAVLNNSLKTEVIMTGNLNCWDHFFHLRCAPDAHPDIQVVAKMVKAEIDQLR
jgi:thymidylate synthase (FAD)